ncbi:hypothetical protein ND748_04500 [Frankia sp. AiPs1]|uniref:hypothetical protein n=1 Tax=Frankia sp. AiPs1 TaxID=573493 RepID=UPI002043C7F8|nr:hypothetical protein [Frankia sp. AiPs1]MCM3920938.1 hypothetical protein [Frankia sp. AiPs1]
MHARAARNSTRSPATSARSRTRSPARTTPPSPTGSPRSAATTYPYCATYATGLERDLDAVTAGLTLPHNSGPVEDHVNRIKMIKGQMYGHANLDLLRKRVLLAS